MFLRGSLNSLCSLLSTLKQEEANKTPPLELALPIRDLPPDAVQGKHLCRLPPLDTSTLVGVFVEYIVSPSQFYIRIYSPDSSKLLEDMMIEMRYGWVGISTRRLPRPSLSSRWHPGKEQKKVVLAEHTLLKKFKKFMGARGKATGISQIRESEQ